MRAALGKTPHTHMPTAVRPRDPVGKAQGETQPLLPPSPPPFPPPPLPKETDGDGSGLLRFPEDDSDRSCFLSPTQQPQPALPRLGAPSPHLPRQSPVPGDNAGPRGRRGRDTPFPGLAEEGLPVPQPGLTPGGPSCTPSALGETPPKPLTSCPPADVSTPEQQGGPCVLGSPLVSREGQGLGSSG